MWFLEMVPLDVKICDLKRQGKLSSPTNLPHNKEVGTGCPQLILPFKKEEEHVPRGAETTPVPSLGPGPAVWEWLSMALGSTLWLILPFPKGMVSAGSQIDV